MTYKVTENVSFRLHVEDKSHAYLIFDNEPPLMTYKVTDNVSFRLRVEDTEPRLPDP
jgi:hypothetical protein